MSNFRSYSAAFHESNDDICHYGVLGMKWGVRRYQKYPSGYKGDGVERIQTKHLNANSRNAQVNTRAMEIAKKKMKKYDKKSDQYKKWAKHYKEAEASKKYANDEIKKILSKIAKRSEVNKKLTSGLVETPGESIARVTAWGLGGLLPGLAVTGYNANKEDGSYREYTRYKIRKKKKK